MEGSRRGYAYHMRGREELSSSLEKHRECMNREATPASGNGWKIEINRSRSNCVLSDICIVVTP